MLIRAFERSSGARRFTISVRDPYLEPLLVRGQRISGRRLGNSLDSRSWGTQLRDLNVRRHFERSATSNAADAACDRNSDDL